MRTTTIENQVKHILTHKRQWVSGEFVPLWKKGNLMAYLVEESSFISLYIFREASEDGKLDYCHSPKLVVGIFDPSKGWQLTFKKDTYTQWANKSRAVLTAHRNPIMAMLVSTEKQVASSVKSGVNYKY